MSCAQVQMYQPYAVSSNAYPVDVRHGLQLKEKSDTPFSEPVESDEAEVPIKRKSCGPADCSALCPPTHPPTPQQQQHSSCASASPPTSTPNETVKCLANNCIMVRHYEGDVVSVVQEHFTRALAQAQAQYDRTQSLSAKASSPPMSCRNFPASFWNSHYYRPLSSHLASGAPPSELYDPYHGTLHSLQASAAHHEASWPYSFASPQSYGQRSVAHDMYQAAMSSVPSTSRPPYYQYSSFSFQTPPLARLPPSMAAAAAVSSQMPMTKADNGWSAHFNSPEFSHCLEANYSASHYSNVPGLETGVPQEGAKDPYWF